VDVLNKGIIYNCNLSITPALLFKVIPVSDRDGVRFLVEALIVLGGMKNGAAISGLYSAEIISMQTM